MTVAPPYESMSTTSRPEAIFTKCCCCIPLRIGCLILGYINLVYNTINSLGLLTMTIYIGISTNGFATFHAERQNATSEVPEMELLERQALNELGILFIVVVCANIVWMVINVACLVGLHKKRPGPIRVYIFFAIARLLFSFVYFLSMATSDRISNQTFLTLSIDIGLAVYFIMVYYIYASQLKWQQATASQNPNTNVSNFADMYPTKIDKQILVA